LSLRKAFQPSYHVATSLKSGSSSSSAPRSRATANQVTAGVPSRARARCDHAPHGETHANSPPPATQTTTRTIVIPLSCRPLSQRLSPMRQLRCGKHGKFCTCRNRPKPCPERIRPPHRPIPHLIAPSAAAKSPRTRRRTDRRASMARLPPPGVASAPWPIPSLIWLLPLKHTAVGCSAQQSRRTHHPRRRRRASHGASGLRCGWRAHSDHQQE